MKVIYLFPDSDKPLKNAAHSTFPVQRKIAHRPLSRSSSLVLQLIT